MNHFSDLLDTDTDLDFAIRFSPVIDNGDAKISVSVNDRILYDGSLSGCRHLVTQIHLLDPITVSVSVSNRLPDTDQKTYTVISEITLDGCNIMQHAYDLTVFQNDRGQEIKTWHLDQNGSWRLKIPEPFLNWWHKKSAQGTLLAPARLIKD